MADFDASTASAIAAASALAADRVLAYSPGNGTWEVFTLDTLLQALARVASAAGPLSFTSGTDVVINCGSGGAIIFKSNGTQVGLFRADNQLFSANNGLYTTQILSSGSGTATMTIPAAGGVITLGSTTWIQQTQARSRVGSDATNASTAFSSLANLTHTLVAGRKYTGRLVVRCSDSVAADGIKFDFNGGTATMTTFNAVVMDNPQAATAGTILSSSLAGALNFTATNGTGDNWFVIEFSFVVNAGGTFIPRFAQNAHSTGTATVSAGSFMWLEDMP